MLLSYILKVSTSLFANIVVKKIITPYFLLFFNFKNINIFLTILQMSYNQYYAAIDIHISTNTNILNKTETDIRFRQI